MLPKLKHMLRSMLSFVFALSMYVSAVGAGPSAQAWSWGAPKKEDLAARTTVQGGNNRPAYVLETQDVLQVTVFRHSDLNSSVRVDGEGRVTLPLVGDVELGGLTLEAASRKIERAYKTGRFLKNPAVRLHVSGYAPRQVSVLGEVQRPGQINFPPETNALDIVEVISLAGGFTRIAKSKDVHVTRTHKETGKEIKEKINVDAIISDAKSRSQAYLIQPGDVIFVPERLF